jgi:hypothetical protein
MIDIETLVAMDLENSAEWRRCKAEEYPEDCRNLKAASMLERLAGGVQKLEGSELHTRACSLFLENDNTALRFTEELSELTRQVGFHWFGDDPREFLGDLIERVEARVSRG